MLVSVIIPAFGRQKTLALAVQSAAQQLLPDGCELEIIIVDDASPEPIIQPGGFANLSLLRLHENSGAAGARNAGIVASRGDYIAFLDSDDAWLPNKLLNQLNLAEELERSFDRSRLVLACSFYMPNRLDGQLELRIPREAYSVSGFASGCWMCPGTTLFAHKSVFERSGPLDSRLRRLEDYEWMLRFAFDVGRLCVVREAGAVIAPSSGSRMKPVAEATDLIRKVLQTEYKQALSGADRKTVESYLELELTAASMFERDRAGSLYHLMKSLLLKPRFRPAIADHWERIDNVPTEVRELYEKLSSTAGADQTHASN